MLSPNTDASATTALVSLPSRLQGGFGALADADVSAEGAKLAALQIKQQLVIQAPAIANRQPQVLLMLFP